MILADLLAGFLKVGLLAISLIRDVVLSHGWIGEETLTYMIAVSESTPGPIMVNLATYVGSLRAGFAGALIATAAVVLPSFVIILLVTDLMKKALKNPYVQAVLRGMKPCMIGIVLATGVFMILRHCVALDQIKSTYLGCSDISGDGKITPEDSRIVLRKSVRLD